MGLVYPLNLEEWEDWHQSTQKRSSWRKPLIRKELKMPTSGYLYVKGKNPSVLIVLDSVSPTLSSSLLRPLQYFQQSYAVWTPIGNLNSFIDYSLKELGNAPLEEFGELESIQLVLSSGHFTKHGKSSYDFSRSKKHKYVVVQHGLMTPYAPPLPSDSILFAFSQQDAEFWISGRDDVDYEVVGSQLFYEASQKPKTESIDPNSLVFLGQMHGAELPRRSFAQASYRFCRKYGATYRPHPSEKDKLSVLTHKLWAHQGIELDYSGTPLNQLNNPVVSIFSTGVLEAAIRGIPAWVYHPNPPAWLTEFWKRYGMSQWGSTPTPAPAQPRIEPAQQIARTIAQKLEN